jgi:hypothetical protein
MRPILHQFKIKTERHAVQWRKIIGTIPHTDIVTLDHEEFQRLRSQIDDIRPPVTELKPIGRPVGSMGKTNRKKSTISLHEGDWDKLDEIGPSRGMAVQKLLEDKEDG